jgi:hypothetical protein
MVQVHVTVEISDQDVKDMLWLMFDHSEFAAINSPSQDVLARLRDAGILDERIIYLDAGLAHCYFIAKEKDGEEILKRYLIKMSSEPDTETSLSRA